MKNKKEGAILLVNSIGLFGAKLLMERREEEVKSLFPAFFVQEAGENIEAALDKKAVIEEIIKSEDLVKHSLYVKELGEGGLYNALWLMGEALDTGMEIEASRITVLQETIEILDHFDLNPYYTESQGAYLLVSTNAARDLWTFWQQDISCSLIGILTPPPARNIISGTKKEHIRSLDRPQPDPLHQLLA